MGNHRAPRRGAKSATPGAPVAARAGGKRKAVKPTAARGSFLRALPSTPVALGVVALTLSATGAVTLGQSSVEPAAAQPLRLTQAAGAMTGTSQVASTSALSQREQAVSRDSRRDALQDASSEQLKEAADAIAQERSAELKKLAESAEKHSAELALNGWTLPLTSYRITASFGQSSGLWANTHTGLDFAAPKGTPVMSVTSGTVTSVASAGAYGQRIIITTDKGEELWYAHLSAYAVSVGDQVRPGEVVGYVGSTGNSTGPHLHLEVRPGAGDPVDPRQALIAHGLRP
ncbi:M23 family metallopeptidase [Nocardioides sp. AE5]|uniref:M23 family metallopeptidase n=1 Tax=Nocardioides sp. AE5 TaxID=2962573 RepID=UPI0028829554|nr:M23 family metallopeptidase [Nocardioides sp. AE5]MDT0201997.1 M23 family metallopeptidase [Nocardioides sp. AE5]